MAIINGGNGNDPFLFGTNLDDIIRGFAGHDTLFGYEGDDVLDGGTGNDYMNGGAGSDTYIVDSLNDRIFDLIGSGADTVRATITYTIGSDIEILELIGASAIAGFGNLKNNTITGNNADNDLYGSLGDDRLFGGGGRDYLDGGGDNDFMAGGTGDDEYVVESSGDRVFEKFNEGIDTVRSSLSYTLSFNLENLVLTGVTSLNGTGNGHANRIVGNAGVNTLEGGDGNDTLFGEAGNDRLDGEFGNDTMYGGLGNDVLVGEEGNDTMYGEAGSDTYRVYSAFSRVIEQLNQGTDTVLANVSYTLTAHVENLELLLSAVNGTGNELANVITGNQSANIIDGKAGIDVMHGKRGNDIYYVDDVRDRTIELVNEGTDTVRSTATYVLGLEVENLELMGKLAINGTGNAKNNILRGNIAANELDGKAGADSMYGGRGNDFYTVDNSLDAVVELANEGTDSVNAFVTHTLGANVENLILRGTAVINGAGNALHNVITGNNQANTLSGGEGNDTLYGNFGNDVLIGGGGRDALDGGDGFDTASYESSTTSLVISLLVPADNTGDATGDTYTSIERVRGSNVSGAGDVMAAADGFGAWLEGLDGNDTLFGRAGEDTLDGGAGNDVIYGGLFDTTDTIYGGLGDDQLSGEGGNDHLTGNAGRDTMDGGFGTDRFYFLDASDSVVGNGDVINNFSGSLADGDKLDFTLMPTPSGFFVYLADGDFTAQGEAEIRFFAINAGADTVVSVDQDGNGVADMEITLVGYNSLKADDLAL